MAARLIRSLSAGKFLRTNRLSHTVGLKILLISHGHDLVGCDHHIGVSGGSQIHVLYICTCNPAERSVSYGVLILSLPPAWQKLLFSTVHVLWWTFYFKIIFIFNISRQCPSVWCQKVGCNKSKAYSVFLLTEMHV